MYIAHGLTIAHDGKIWIRDAEGGGARIETLWPVFALDD
jgi:signal transduction histidine kinase